MTTTATRSDLAVKTEGPTHLPAKQGAFDATALHRPTGFMAPATMKEALEVAQLLSNSKLIPEIFRGKPDDILVVLEMGANVGIPPLMALQSTAMIGGRPVLWGDVPHGLVLAHPSFVDLKEWLEGEGEARIAHCRLTRVNRHGTLVVTENKFSWVTARANSLTNKDTYKGYGDDMLKRRARSRVHSDGASDILKGFSPTDYDYEILEGVGIDKQTGEVLGSQQARVALALETRAAQAGSGAPAAATPAALPATPPSPPIPDLSGMTDIEIGELVASEAQARGIQPAALREIVKTVGGGKLVRSTAPRILGKLFETPIAETTPA